MTSYKEKPTQRKLCLFFSRSVGLKTWIDTGLFLREKKVYDELLKSKNISVIYWLTYGRGDENLAQTLHETGRLDSNIKVLSPPRYFPEGKYWDILYSLLLPFVHYRTIKNANFIKSNQLDGAWSAVIAKFLTSKPLIIRCGYIQSKMETQSKKVNFFRLAIMKFNEHLCFHFSSKIFIASLHDFNFVSSLNSKWGRKATIIRNYVDVELFHPRVSDQNKKPRAVFVGRLNSQKNLFNLISAAHSLRMGLDIVGKGELKEKLALHAKNIGADVNFLGVFSNDRLPAIISKYQLFCIPSLVEGMPKSLIEAMACGLRCVGTDVDGINELIINKRTGFVSVSPRIDDIALAIETALNNKDKSIEENARRLIEEKFSLQSVSKLELRELGSL